MRYKQMYILEFSDPQRAAREYPTLYGGVYTTVEKAQDALFNSGFMPELAPDGRSVQFSKYDLKAFICRCPVNPMIGKEKVELR